MVGIRQNGLDGYSHHFLHIRAASTLNVITESDAQLNRNAAGAQAVNRSSVAALTFLVWDIIITMDQEVSVMWKRRVTLTKIFYFFVRYFPVAVHVSILFVGTELTPLFHFTPHDCYIWQVWQGVSSLLLTSAVDVILVLRVYALYSQSRFILWFLGTALVFEIALAATSLALSLPGITFDAVCTVMTVPPTILIYGAASIIYQLILFGMTLYKFITAARAGRGRRIPLLTLLTRDGTWAFGVILTVMLLQASLYLLPANYEGYTGIFYGWMITAFSVCGYRILLNIASLGAPSAPLMPDAAMTMSTLKETKTGC